MHRGVVGTWMPTGSLSTGRRLFTLTSLSNGIVLAAGGDGNTDSFLSSSEIYDPNTGTYRSGVSDGLPLQKRGLQLAVS